MQPIKKFNPLERKNGEQTRPDDKKHSKLKNLVAALPFINKVESKKKLSELEVLSTLVTSSITKVIPDVNHQMINLQVQKLLEGDIADISLGDSLYINLTTVYVEYFNSIDFNNSDLISLEEESIKYLNSNLIDNIVKQYLLSYNNNISNLLPSNPMFEEEPFKSIVKFNLKGELIVIYEAMSDKDKRLFIQSFVSSINVINPNINDTPKGIIHEVEKIRLIELISAITSESKKSFESEFDDDFVNSLVLTNSRTKEEFEKVNPVRVGENEINQIAVFTKISTLLKSLNYQLSQPSELHINNFNKPNLYCLLNYFSSGEFKYKVGISNNKLYIECSFNDSKFKEQIDIDISKYKDTIEIEEEIKRKLSSYEERITAKSEQEPPTPSKNSYKGKYIVRYGVESNKDDASRIQDQILILTSDGRSESINTNLISNKYSDPYLKRPQENPLFFLHEVTHGLATGIIYHGFAQLRDKFKPKNNTDNQARQSFSLLGEGVVAALSGELFNNRFNASTRSFNHTVLLTKFYIKYIFDSLNNGSMDYKKNSIIRDYEYEKNNGQKNFDTYRKSNYGDKVDAVEEPLIILQSKISEMKETLERMYLDQKQQHIQEHLEKSKKEKTTESDMEIDFDFSQTGLYEVIEGIDKVDFTGKLFLSILKSIKSAKKLWESQTFKSNCILNLKVKDDADDLLFGPVDEEAGNNFKLWYNALDSDVQSEFSTWLTLYIENLEPEKKDEFLLQCSDIFQNMNISSEENKDDIFKTKSYSQSLLDIGGESAIF